MHGFVVLGLNGLANPAAGGIITLINPSFNPFGASLKDE